MLRRRQPTVSTPTTRDRIEALFPGLELIASGGETDEWLLQLIDWWPDDPRGREPMPIERCILGAVARTP